MKIIIIFATSFLLGCGAQETVVNSISCNENITVQYDKVSFRAKQEGLRTDKNKDSFVVHFLNDFDVNVKGYVNDKLLFNERVTTRQSTSESGKYFGYNYSKDSINPILKISLLDKDKCFDIEIDKKYKLIYIFLTKNNKWIVRFSNEYYLHN